MTWRKQIIKRGKSADLFVHIDDPASLEGTLYRLPRPSYARKFRQPISFSSWLVDGAAPPLVTDWKLETVQSSAWGLEAVQASSWGVETVQSSSWAQETTPGSGSVS